MNAKYSKCCLFNSLFIIWLAHLFIILSTGDICLYFIHCYAYVYEIYTGILNFFHSSKSNHASSHVPAFAYIRMSHLK